MVVLSHVFRSLILAAESTLPPELTSIKEIESLSISIASSMTNPQTSNADLSHWLLVLFLRSFDNKDSLSSEFFTTYNESLKRSLGSVVLEV